MVEDDERLYTAYPVADGIFKDEFASPPGPTHLLRVGELLRRPFDDANSAEREPEMRAA